jgi:acyl-CoA dehydrogenase
MAWDFCADRDFQPTLDWVQRFVDDELRPLEPLLPHLSPQQTKSLLDPLKEQVRERGLWRR